VRGKQKVTLRETEKRLEEMGKKTKDWMGKKLDNKKRKLGLISRGRLVD